MTDAQPEGQMVRYRPRWERIIAVGLIVVVLLVLGALFVGSINKRLASARKVDRATTIARDTDAGVVAIDSAVRAPIDEKSVETKALAARRIAEVREQLEQAVVLVNESYASLNDDERKTALLLRATLEARLEMLKLAEPILAADAKAAASAKELTGGWDRLVAAKALSKDAAAQYNKLTKASVAASNNLLTQVRSQLDTATAGFEAAAQAFPALDAKPYLDYIATLKQLNSLALKSNQAWLKGQTAQANSFTARYNILEKQAVTQAGALPTSPNKAIAEAYDQATTRELRAYVAARKKATEADTRLRQH